MKTSLFALFLMSFLTSCGDVNQLNDSINQSTYSIHENRQAIENSTRAILENRQSIVNSTQVIHQNTNAIKDSNQATSENRKLLENELKKKLRVNFVFKRRQVKLKFFL